jgi:hypothetical protein
LGILQEVHALTVSLSVHDTVNKEGYYWSSTQNATIIAQPTLLPSINGRM